MKTVAVVGGLALASSAFGQSFYIDFESLGSGTVVTNQFAASFVLFGTDAADLDGNDILTSSGLEISGVNTLRAEFDGTISFSFTTLVSEVSLFALSVEDASSVAYYRGGMLLFQDIRPGTGDFFIPEFYSYADAGGIDHVVVTAFDGQSGDPFAIDDLRYTLVPAPGAFAQFVLAGVVSARRRRG